MSEHNQTRQESGGRRLQRRPGAESEVHLLRRRLTFWRRTAWLLAGTFLIVGFVVWQRGNNRRRDCSNALQHYAKLAESSKLAAEPEGVLEVEWQHLDEGSVHQSPTHYFLFVSNWTRVPQGDERLPLAICGSSHRLLFEQGRHVLFRNAEGFQIEWLSEEEAAPLQLRNKRSH